MLLTIDIGNTQVVLGVFDQGRLSHCWRVATLKGRTEDEYAVILDDLFELAGMSTSVIQAVIICSVVPPLNDCFQVMCRKYLHLDPCFIEPASQDLIPIRYKPASDVGADRIVNAAATVKMFGAPAIVVDFGTATTFDAISKQGEYLGGIIAPGIGISAEALFIRTAKLPRVEIKRPPRVIGDSTVGSLQSGIYFGYVGLVEGILGRMTEELDQPVIVATGGLAELICSGLKQIDRVEENLTVYGLNLFYEWHPANKRTKEQENKRAKE